MASEDPTTKLQVEHTALKQRTSELSGDVTRLQKQLGTALHRIGELQVLVDEGEEVSYSLKQANKRISELEGQAKTLQAVADESAKAVEAGKKIAEGLTLLAGL